MLAAAIVDDPRWFGGVDLPKVVDAGLRPRDARRFRGLCQRSASGPEATSAVRPRVLSGVLASVIRRDAESGSADGGVVWAGDAWAHGDDEVG
jgi:hypothetical protein